MIKLHRRCEGQGRTLAVKEIFGCGWTKCEAGHMIRFMFFHTSERRRPRKLGSLAVAAATSLALSTVTAGIAHAAPGENLDDECLQFSQNDGTDWIDFRDLVWSNENPSPGIDGEITHAEFLVQNDCETPAKLQIWSGLWEVSDGATATVRATIDGESSERVEITGQGTETPGTENGPEMLIETGELDGPVPVSLHIGIPAEEETQSFTIAPGWALFLEVVEPGNDDPDPTDPDEPGSGSLPEGSLGSDSGSLGSLSSGSSSVTGGSHDLFGSLSS